MAQKYKTNAYAIFVRESTRRMGITGNISRWFSRLGDKWKELPENEKQNYRDKAKHINEDLTDNQGHSRSQSTESFPRHGDVKYSTAKSEPDKTRSDTKQDLKRTLENDESHLEQVKKPRIGIPGYKKQEGKNSLFEARTYFDQQLFDMYKTCEDIVTSRPNYIDLPLFTISINTLCKYRKGEEVFFIPIEVAIYGYSIKNGTLGKPYHVMIDAGKPPQNYLNAALDHAANHKITFPPTNMYPKEARNDYKRIYSEMLDYVRTGERTVLIAQARDYMQVKKCLEWLHNKASEDGSRLPTANTWTILPVIEFVASMHDNVTKGLLHSATPKLANRYLMKTLVDSSTHEYNTAFMCPYHEKEENQTRWCAKTCATKAIVSLEEVLEEIYRLYKQAEMIALEPSEERLAIAEH